MKRTVHCRVFANQREFAALWPEIDCVQRELSPFLPSIKLPLIERVTNDDRSTPWRRARLEDARGTMPCAAGSVQTGRDAFATFVVFRFMRWISKRLPHGRVLVNDEGDFAPTWYLECVQGRFWLDERSAASDDLPPFWKLLDKVCARWMMDRGSGFRYDDRFLKPKASTYADREPIKRLSLSKEDLSTMTLEDIAGLIIFPWQRL